MTLPENELIKRPQRLKRENALTLNKVVEEWVKTKDGRQLIRIGPEAPLCRHRSNG